MFSIQVLFPPQADPGFIPFRASTLAKRLRLMNHDVRLDDDNQQAYAYFLDPERLKFRIQEAEHALHLMEQQEGQTFESLQEEYRYYRTGRALLYGTNLPEKVTSALEVLRRPEFSLEEADEAKKVLQHALEVAGLPSSPSLISLNDLNMQYSSESSEHIVKAAREDEINPYVEFWQARLQQIKQDQPDAVLFWIELDQQLIPAYTLARLIKEVGVAAELILAGPFVEFYGEKLAEDGPWKTWFDHVVYEPGMLQSLVVKGQKRMDAGAKYEDVWSVEGLPLNSYLGQPATVVLNLQEGVHIFESTQATEAVMGLYGRMSALALENASLRFYINPSVRPELLCALAEQMIQDEFQSEWGSIVYFGTSLSSEQARLLASAGCKFLHFECKGFLGYPDVETGKQQMVENWKHAHEAGIHVLMSAVFGHPNESLESFAAFSTFVGEQYDAIDRIPRFQLYRLFWNSDFWRNPGAYGIYELESPRADRDLQRHFSFKSEAGVDKDLLYPLALEHIGKMKQRTYDFPALALRLDDWAFHAPQETTAPKAEQQTYIHSDEPATWRISPHVEVRRFAYPFGDLERRWKVFLIGQMPWPQEELLMKAPTFVMYRKDVGRLSVINGAVYKVLQLCNQPITEADLTAQFQAKQAESLKALLKKVAAEGMIQRYGETGAVVSH
jgi:hypothetical protein